MHSQQALTKALRLRLLSNMWNPIKNYRLRRDWRLVDTLEASFRWHKEGEPTGEETEIFYYLYENGLGKRKCEIAASNHKGTLQAKQHPRYLRNIRPWVEGRFDPNVPSYETIKAKEFKDALAGKVT